MLYTLTNCSKPSYQYNDEEARRKLREYQERQRKENQRPCLHNGCTECRGTGRKADGSMCVHYISCPCPKCSIRI